MHAVASFNTFTPYPFCVLTSDFLSAASDLHLELPPAHSLSSCSSSSVSCLSLNSSLHSRHHEGAPT
eukprot:766066-Hanusia_phi.AAC.2